MQTVPPSIRMPGPPSHRLVRRRLAAAALGLALAARSGTAPALEVTRARVVAAPPAAVWSLIGGFCDIARWHPQVAGCTLSREDGAPVRALVAAGGLGTILEIETARDEAGLRYAYRLISGPLPVKGYAAVLAVTPIGRGAMVTWTATFEADGMSDAEAVADIAGVYEAGLAGIAREVAP
ncbi:SRPBCC family protein [uncultured Methylobacterium sp.]|uniref:SRPBCC family protein n=1 Tax=uncultured Methylobacterium sp. TaxID=157278 RepID=UPI0035CB4043